MPREMSGAPRAVTFADLFDDLGAADLRYSATARSLNGSDVTIEGYLSHAHAPGAHTSLVHEEGACPDCALIPVAAIALPGLRPTLCESASDRVRIAGRLDYGFRIADGVASMLRIEDASLLQPDTSA
jgi:hypothetical protein